ncbi:MAG: hypothetical protein DCC67_13860 [Planctomycetota bacterium]|nr:MAG: hypothetical protein DCC67_13860 [Planctomycetota bacterium]
MKTSMSSKGQIILPAELRKEDGLKTGQRFAVERVKRGEYLLKTIEEPPGDIAEWLLSCPVKGWFTPIPSESTDTL